MNYLSTPRIVISGVTADAGASQVALGLAFEMRKRGVGVSCCVLGTHLQTALILRRICGRYVPCLDRRILNKEAMLTGMYLAGLGSDILLIVGEECLYDGIAASTLVGSNAEAAVLSKAPVLLVADSKTAGNSMGALLKGYVELGTGLDIAGAVINNVNENGKPRDINFYKECMDNLSVTHLYGGISRFEEGGFDLPKGVQQAFNNTSIPRTFLVDLGSKVAQSVEIDALIERAGHCERIGISSFDSPPVGRKTTLAVSEDLCFSLCFQENLELLKYSGANLVTFSPIADSALPDDIGGVYLTGGYLAEYAEQVTQNIDFMRSLRQFAESGGVIYAEGAGTAVLCEKFQLDQNRVIQGAGVIPAMCRMHPEQLMFIAGEGTEDSILGSRGTTTGGIYTNDWRLVSEESIFRTMRFYSAGSTNLYEGFSPAAQTFCTFGFISFLANTGVAESLVEACAVNHTLD